MRVPQASDWGGMSRSGGVGAIWGGGIEATEKVKAVYSAPFDLELRVYFQQILNSSEALAGAVSDVCVCVCVCRQNSSPLLHASAYVSACSQRE